jgi:hypothetical protein
LALAQQFNTSTSLGRLTLNILLLPQMAQTVGVSRSGFSRKANRSERRAITHEFFDKQAATMRREQDGFEFRAHTRTLSDMLP